jgi:hypothetical protein
MTRCQCSLKPPLTTRTRFALMLLSLGANHTCMHAIIINAHYHQPRAHASPSCFHHLVQTTRACTPSSSTPTTTNHAHTLRPRAFITWCKPHVHARHHCQRPLPPTTRTRNALELSSLGAKHTCVHARHHRQCPLKPPPTELIGAAAPSNMEHRPPAHTHRPRALHT